MYYKHKERYKQYLQIGNYIFANGSGHVIVAIPKGEQLSDEKISSDLDYLIKNYGIKQANFFLDCCSEFINNQ